MVQGFRVADFSVEVRMRRGAARMGRIVAEGRVGGKRRTRRGPKDGRFDDIDDADDIDDPRTEGRRRRVRQVSRTPEGARKAEGGGCALRRGVVDVVDVVGSSKGRGRGRLPPRGGVALDAAAEVLILWPRGPAVVRPPLPSNLSPLPSRP